MNTGFAKLASLATFACLCDAVAGWNTNAWPTSSATWGATTRSNVYVHYNVDTWLQESTTNYIPSVPGSALPARPFLFKDYYVTNVGLTAVSGACTRVWTNRFIHYPTTQADFAPYLWRSGHHAATQSFEYASTTQTLVTSVTFTNWMQVTNVTLYAPDLWAADSIDALTRRGDTNNLLLFGSYSRVPKDFLETDYTVWDDWAVAEDNLYTIKEIVRLRLDEFVNFALMTNGAFDAYAEDFGLTNNTDNPVPPWINETFFAYLNLPTNWPDWQPSRDLGGRGPGEGHVVTSRFVIATSGSTNTVKDYCGNSHDISGTNGQVVSVVCTNMNVMDGWTTSDYGYKHMTNVMSALTDKQASATFSTNSSLTVTGTGQSTQSWAAAKAIAETNITIETSSGPRDSLDVRTSGQFNPANELNPQQYTASWIAERVRFDVTTGTNYEATAWIYAYYKTRPTPTNYFFDANMQTNAVVNRWRMSGTTTNTSTGTATFFIGQTNLPTWCDSPSTSETNTTYSARGYFMEGVAGHVRRKYD